MIDDKEFNLQCWPRHTKDFVILFTLFLCFIPSTIANHKMDEHYGSRHNLRSLISKDYDSDVSGRAILQFISVTIPYDLRSLCIISNMTFHPCVFFIKIQAVEGSNLHLHAWHADLRTVIGSIVKKFPYTFNFEAFMGKKANPLRLDFQLFKDPKAQGFSCALWIEIYCLGWKVKPSLISTLHFEKMYVPGESRRTQLTSKKNIKLSFSFEYKKVYCNDTAPSNECSGHFKCGKDGKRICASYYYGMHCRRFCKPGFAYTCDKEGYQICKPTFHGHYCRRKCVSTRRNRCDSKGREICLPGYELLEGQCISKCVLTNRCFNGGVCKVISGKARCFCMKGWTGRSCQTATCSLYDCKNGGKCVKVRRGVKRCRCPVDFFGRYCEAHIGCQYKSRIWCLNFAECKDRKNGIPICKCLSGFYGDRCQYKIQFGKELDQIDVFVFSKLDADHIILLVVMIFCLIYTVVLIWICGWKMICQQNGGI